jgi:hypothetical protein
MIQLLQIPAPLLGTLIVSLVIVCSIVGLLAVRRHWSHEVLTSSNDVTDSVYSMIGALYAVLLAFVVVVVWGQFTIAEDRAQIEAGDVGDLFREAGAFPPETRNELQAHLINYARDVVDREWPAMAKGESIELESPAFKQLWAGYMKIQPETNAQIAFHNESINRLNDLGNKRQLRILSSQSELPAMLWVLLIGGSIISILYTYLLGTESRGVHLLVVIMLSALLGFALFLIFSLEHPYSGSLSVKPDGFRHVLQTLK